MPTTQSNTYFFLFLGLAAAAFVAAARDNAEKPDAAPAPRAVAQAEQPRTFVYSYKTPQLHRAAVDVLLTVPGKILFLDLRRPDEISRIGTFPVYLNVQLADLEQQLDFIPKERAIVTVSNHAARAGKAGDLLADKGFKVIGAVGSQIYEQEGGAITRIVAPARAAAQGAEASSAVAARP